MQATESEIGPAPAAKIPHENQAAQLLHMCRGPSYISCLFSGWWFCLIEHLWAQGQVCWFCVFSCGVVVPPGSNSSSSPSSIGFTAFCVMFGYVSPYLVPSVAACSPSDGDYDRLMSRSTVEY